MKRILIVLVVAAVIVFSAFPALAARPLDVQIVAETQIFQTEPDTFFASGPAVDEGVICPTGDLTNGPFSTSDIAGGKFRIIRIIKQFDCADGSGSFDVKLVAHINLATGYSSGHWGVKSGDGDYARLRGHGNLSSVPLIPGESVTDTFIGKLH